MKINRESTIIYRSFYESIRELPPEQQADVWRAVCEYAFNDADIKITGMAKAIFTAIRPQLVANRKRYKDGCKGGKFGNLGGRPKKENPTGDINKNP